MYRFARLRAAPMLGHTDRAVRRFASPARCGSAATAIVVLDGSGNKQKQETCQFPNARFSPAKAVYTQDRNYLGRSANKWELAPDIWMPIFSAGSIKSVNPWYIPETKRRRHVFWVWYRTSLS